MRKAVVGITMLLFSAALHADEKLDDRMLHSASILQEIRGPLDEDAPGVLENAHAVAIFPEFLKVGLLGGVKHGRGVLATRQASGDWSKPAFVRITSGSIGLQLGVSMSQLLIVFKDPKAVEAISGGQFAIGADASYAAGELGGSASAGTGARLQNRIVAMARSKGLFAGVALDGGVLRIERDANVEFYNDAIGLDGRRLLEDTEVELPPVAQHFLIILGESVPPLSDESTLVDGESDAEVDLRFAGDENAEAVADPAAAPKNLATQPGDARVSTEPALRRSKQKQLSASPAAEGNSRVSANAAPETGTWLTPASTSPAPRGGQASGPGLGSRIAGKIGETALDAARELAVDSVRNDREVQGAKLAADVGKEVVKAVVPDGSPPPKRILSKPGNAVASTQGAGTWVTPGSPNYQLASGGVPATASTGNPIYSTAGSATNPVSTVASASTDITGPPSPSDWPEEWRTAQILGGVCEPGS